MKFLTVILIGAVLSLFSAGGAAAEEARATHKESDSRRSALVVDGRTYDPQSARFEMIVVTEDWVQEKKQWVYGQAPHVMLSLEIMVDERSGEDGALAPDCGIVPIRPLPALVSLPDMVFDEKAASFEAYYGNDAPELTANVFRIIGFPAPDRVRLQWSARYEEKGRLRFDGIVPFDGIRMQVKAPADAERLLRVAWPALDLSKVKRHDGKWTEYPGDIPADRRRWLNVTFTLK
ncbi:MAG: hypothetical protein RDV48_20225 [Candidatus Eremiobacteraeota bacterium]|nr:hypothetical protein [Candidatus Eremiobacteraeota bacterium]